MRRRRLPALLLALALASGASACTTSQPGSGISPPAKGVVFAKGGTVVVAVSSLPSNFNPSAPDGANRITAEVMAQVWPQTFVTDDRLETTAEAGFVEDAEVESISPFTVVYTLNPKATWSDGVPIGVKDFIYNWHEQLLWAPQLPGSRPDRIGSTKTTPIAVAMAPAVCRIIVPIASENNPSTVR